SVILYLYILLYFTLSFSCLLCTFSFSLTPFPSLLLISFFSLVPSLPISFLSLHPFPCHAHMGGMVISISLSLSLCLSVCLSVCLSITHKHTHNHLFAPHLPLVRTQAHPRHSDNRDRKSGV